MNEKFYTPLEVEGASGNQLRRGSAGDAHRALYAYDAQADEWPSTLSVDEHELLTTNWWVD